MDECTILLSQIRDLLHQVDDHIDVTLQACDLTIMSIDQILDEDIVAKETCITIETNRIVKARQFSQEKVAECFNLIKQEIKVMRNHAKEQSDGLRQEYREKTGKIEKGLREWHTAIKTFYDTSKDSIDTIADKYRIEPKSYKYKLLQEAETIKDNFDALKVETKNALNLADNKIIIMDGDLQKSIMAIKKFNKRIYDELYAKIRLRK